MPPESLKLLEDMRQAAHDVIAMVQGNSIDNYFKKTMQLWSIIERKDKNDYVKEGSMTQLAGAVAPIIMSPDEFWEAFSEQLNNIGTHAAYANFRQWTKQAKTAAKKAWTGRGLQSRCWLHFDACGYQNYEMHNWTIRVAFEHEHDAVWRLEICKLCQVHANLRVLVAYWDFDAPRVLEDELLLRLRELQQHENRVLRMPECKWLFVFGPQRNRCLNHPFIAFTLIDDHGGLALRKLLSGAVVKPSEWPP
jgi:hypothetical protein